jgi:hypothetical protein
MRLFGRCTVFLTILLLLFSFRTIRADRGELPPVTVDYHLAAPAEPRYSFSRGGSVASAVNQAFRHLDLDRQESTWSRLVRETLTMNEGLVANPDAADLFGPAANRVGPGTVLTMPAVSVVKNGDKGVSHVLLRLNPELRTNGRAMIRAIRATIAANADVIRNADPGELYDGRFNVVQAGDVLILPPEVMPEEMPPTETRIADETLAEPPKPAEPEPPAVIAAAEPPEPGPRPKAPEAEQPEPAEPAPTVIAEAEAPESVSPAPAPVVETPEPAEPQAPVTVAATRMPEPDPWFPEPKRPVAIAEVETSEPATPVQLPLFDAPETPPSVAATGPAGEAVIAAAAPAEEPAGERAIDPAATEPYPALTELEFNGPIGLTAGETRDRFVPEDKPWTASATHLLYAYMLTGLALLGGLVLFITRWLERDRQFREQLNRLLAPLVFLLTLGRVRRRTVIETPVKGTDPATVPEQDATRSHHGPA